MAVGVAFWTEKRAIAVRRAAVRRERRRWVMGSIQNSKFKVQNEISDGG
jgi:hypothetical protein